MSLIGSGRHCCQTALLNPWSFLLEGQFFGGVPALLRLQCRLPNIDMVQQLDFEVEQSRMMGNLRVSKVKVEFWTWNREIEISKSEFEISNASTEISKLKLKFWKMKAPDLKSRNQKLNAEPKFKMGFMKLNYFCPLTPFIFNMHFQSISFCTHLFCKLIYFSSSIPYFLHFSKPGIINPKNSNKQAG